MIKSKVVIALIFVFSISFGQTQQRYKKIESSLSADELYTNGRDLFMEAAKSDNARLRTENLKKAIKHFEDAVNKDSSYLPAYLALLQCYTSLSGFGSAKDALRAMRSFYFNPRKEGAPC